VQFRLIFKAENGCSSENNQQMCDDGNNVILNIINLYITGKLIKKIWNCLTKKYKHRCSNEQYNKETAYSVKYISILIWDPPMVRNRK